MGGDAYQWDSPVFSIQLRLAFSISVWITILQRRKNPGLWMLVTEWLKRRIDHVGFLHLFLKLLS
jgi:hypothetical protein